MSSNNGSRQHGGRGDPRMNAHAREFVAGGYAPPPPPGQQYPQRGAPYYPQQGYPPQGYPPQGYHPGQYQQQEYYPEEYSGYDYGGDEYDDQDEDDEIDRAIAEMEAELEGGGAKAGGDDGGETLPPFADEMWFPECRNCACCNGFKHGCGCCVGRVKTCTKPDCAVTVTAPGGGVGATATAAPSSPSKPQPQHGKVGGQDSEFWFPECRNCACCQGFKYKCSCVSAKGKATCEDANCQAGASAPSAEPNRPLADLADGELVVEPPSDPVVPPTSAGRPAPAQSGDKLCYFYQQGNCRFGSGCRFSHG